MSTRTVGAHLDAETSDRFRNLTATENRTPSQVLNVALKLLLDLNPGARRTIFAIDGLADEEERSFAARHIGRAALKAYEAIIDARRAELGPANGTNEALDTEDAIEAEAVRLCRP